MTKSIIGGNVQNLLKKIDLGGYEHKFILACGLMNDWMTEVTPLYIGVGTPTHESWKHKKSLLLDFPNMSHESMKEILLFDLTIYY
jgi:hypothetical protein